ncbi:MAG TPA: cation:dicarboxylase symporter family transporter [Gemmatimonadota bacterium]|nr:cation:dicarboxylase symporter family transporter [Gemmatimonadota bacterium]
MNLPVERFSFGRGLTIATLTALCAGVAAGTFVPVDDHAATGTLASVVEAVGAVWVRCLRMVILPLVVSLLVLAILGSHERSRIERLGGAAVGIYLAIYVALALLSASAFPPLIRAFGIARGSLTALEATGPAPEAAPAGLNVGEWLVQIVPTNPFAALAEENILQIVVFTIVFAVAASRLPAASRESLLAFFAPVGHAMLVVVAWLMRVSPIAVFALAFAAAREIGLDAARSLVSFGVMTTIVMVAGILGLSLAAGTLGRVGIARFFRAAWPAQVVALATRSSLATVPALVEGARNRLGLSERVVGFGIPFAASTFKPNRAISSPGKLLFLGWVYGVPIAPLGYLVFVGYVILLAATTVGVPNQHARHVTLPAYLALGIPVEGVVLIASVDMLWDFAATALNSTGYLASTSLLPRRAIATGAEPAPEPVPS